MDEKIGFKNKLDSKFSVSSPGKIILSGEHAVVFGAKAISAAIDLRTTIYSEISDSTDFDLTIKVFQLNRSIEINMSQFLSDIPLMKNIETKVKTIDSHHLFLKFHLGLIISELKDQKSGLIDSENEFLISMFILITILTFKIDENSPLNLILNKKMLTMIVESQIPSGAGLGSSAAYSTCIVSTFLHFFKGLNLSGNLLKEEFHEITKFKEFVKSLAFIGEKYFHNTPSGIDNVTTLSGGLIIFENFQSFQEVRLEDVKLFDVVDIYLVDTQERRETSKFIQIVTKFKNENSKIFSNSLDSIKEISREIESLLYKTDNVARFKQLIELNQLFLEIIQVSTSTIAEYIYKLKSSKISSKITGAGGGGFILIFVDKGQIIPFESLCINNWRKIMLSNEGLRITENL